MAASIPFYYLTLDGEDPCKWSPFGESLLAVGMATKKEQMNSDFSKKYFSVSILCQNHDQVADQAISQCVGCLVPGEYLKPQHERYFSEQFHNFSNRLRALNTKVLPALGFEIFVVAQNEATDETLKKAMTLKDRLVRTGVEERLVRVDTVCDQARLSSISRLRLMNIAHTSAAVALSA
ncbi:hypothetical protein PMI42_06512 [Bradyrhizobium sp. YR681]|uniref:hypothetical protein n=1 Tax=Bradyrhizobium sp. YR681 TaxID=1144344 RepID=UPI00026F6BDB|nr:hypothetical protein [Bradyrhizobium sp. YR681]EJN09822.1 hypothetical protein PMI42_06512 [Bradyrhizobium sp. YR681]